MVSKTSLTGASKYAPMVMQAAKDNNVPAEILFGLIQQESAWNPNAESNKHLPAAKRAKGLMQLMDPTANELGVKNPFDPTQAIPAGATLIDIARLTRAGDVAMLVVAAYVRAACAEACH